MKTIIAILLMALALSASAQTDSIQPAYKRYPTIPAFELLQLDSATTLTKADLQKKPLLLMFFSPDCDHCQHQTEDLLKDIDEFKNVQIVLASFQPMEQIRAFCEKYQLAKHPNIRVGRDTKYMLPPFFRMFNLPYLALYDRKGNLITTFEGNVKTARLMKEFGKK